MTPTLIGLFIETVEKHRKPAQMMRKLEGRWESLSAERVLSDVESLGLGLASLGVEPGDRVALLSENRYEWPVSDLAILGIGAITVPIYPTLTSEQCRYILDNSGAKVVIVSTLAQLEKVRAIAGQLASLGAIVPIDPVPAYGPRDRAFTDLLHQGAEARRADPQAFRRRASAVKPDDIATIIYTSGTTGEPKGAMLTHANIASNCDACLQRITIGPTDTCLSFLPLCHIFERMAGLYAILRAGGTIAYAESMETVAANAQEVRPTLLMGVPRFYEKVYARVMENALSQPPLRRSIFFWGLRTGVEVARARFERRSPPFLAGLLAPIADRLVGGKVRARIGGRLRFCISGGAPLPPKIMEFFFAMGIPVIEGYGLTETSPVICLNVPGKEKPASVGPPVPGVEVKIGDEGEILSRGPHIMKGYFRNEEATRIALRDGWFHTGDIGRLDEENYLFITDRLKELLVTAGGKKVAPQPIEGRLKTSKWISEAVLIGDRRPFVSVLVVPNFVNLESEAATRGWDGGGRDALLAHPEVRALIEREIDTVNARLAKFEQIKKFALLDRELTQEGGELTPTLKVKRRVIDAKFGPIIEALYSASAAPPGA
jgi:long-chain acyl-CoA synthetase